MKAFTVFSNLLPAILTLIAAAPLVADEGLTTFERIFGVPGTLDSAMVERVKALPPCERLLVDTDHDAHGRHTHDYDCSITALPEDRGRPIQTDDQISETFDLRGLPVHPVLRWAEARQFARDAPWARVLFTWDEMNANTAADATHDPHERWEGIISPAADDFPRVGGPACSTLNKRYELADQPSKPLQLYFDQAKAALDWPQPDQAESFFLTKLPSWMPETRLGHRMQTTPAGARYYVDLIRDRLLLALSRRFEDHPRWNDLLTAYQAGDYRQAAEILGKEFETDGRAILSPDRFRSYRRRIAIDVDNRGRPQRDDWPVVLSVRDILQVAPGFTTDSLAIVRSALWIERWQEDAIGQIGMGVIVPPKIDCPY